MKRLLFLLFLFWLTGRSAAGLGQVRLSEIMFNPAGSEYDNEFIEIFNRSETDSVNLTGWRIGDEKALDPLVDAGEGLTVPPQGFVLILDPGYFGKSTRYDSLIPPAALVVTIGDNSFGSGGLSNSVAEKVILVNANGDTVDAYRYSIDNPEGFSDEKVNLYEDTNTGNWQNSRVFNGTPGFQNSVALRSADLALRRVKVDSIALNQEKRLRLSCTVENCGRRVASGWKLDVFLDKNLDGQIEKPGEGIGKVLAGQDLAPGDSVSLTVDVHNLPSGCWPIWLELVWPPDENAANNRISRTVTVPFEPNSLDFTEIMYRPLTGQPEWVELKNTTPDTLWLFHWRFSDENTEAPRPVFERPLSLPPLRYVLLAQDSLEGLPDSLRSRLCVVKNWPTLNNSGDEVHIWGPAGRQISQYSYSGLDVPAGFSLEKVEIPLPGQAPGQWFPSEVKGGTPGRANSVNPLRINGSISLASKDSVFRAVSGKLPVVPVKLKNLGLKSLPVSSIQIVEILSGQNCKLVKEQPAPANLLPGDSADVVLKLDGLAPGAHFLRANWLIPGDGDLADNWVQFQIRCGFPERAILLNEILYAPRPGWPEWVELFNPGESRVDLTHWQIADRRLGTKGAGFPEGTEISPRGYFVVTGDSAFFSFYPEVSRRDVCVSADFPHLGNSADSLFLLDLAGGVVDWLAYRSTWGGQNGHSLERIRPENPARDSTNWASCVADVGATPDGQNSIYLHFAQAGQALLEISPDPFSPDGDGLDDFATFSIHLPWATAQVNLTIFDAQGREVRELLRNQPVGSAYEVLWDGRNGQGRVLPVGLYIAFLEVFNEKMERKSAKKVFVLARRN